MQFVNNSGFLFETAEEFQAMVVFAEHRYYGTSLPNQTTIVDDADYMSFLTVEQAMEDYNALTVHIRKQWNMPPDTAFVAIGGSYGANLALWLRMKNPNLWAGALASSATPLKHILRNTNQFTLIETQAYGNVSSQCPDLVRQGWKDLYRFAGPNATEEEKILVTNELGLCSASSPRPTMLHDWISGALETMVQYGYPYPASFYNPVPGYPFRVTCRKMIEAGSGLGALRAAADIYYNYTGQAGFCYGKNFIQRHALQHLHRKGRLDRISVGGHELFYGSIESDLVTSHQGKTGEQRKVDVAPGNDHSASLFSWPPFLDSINAWGYQVCTEVYQPMPTDGITDFEIPYTPNRTAYFYHCWKRFGVAPREDWEEHHFMGHDVGTTTNVFLSNGQLDPWRAAGIQALPPGASQSSMIIRTIKDAAHHLDLRSSHPLDPESVIEVRKEEKEAMHSWIKEWRELHSPVPHVDHATPI